MHEWSNLSIYLERVLVVVELISALLLIIGFTKAVIRYLQVEWQNRKNLVFSLSQIRLQLSAYILLALDFYIISDIIYSMVKPELNELINLALIVTLRTLIGYFLGRETQEIESSVHKDHYDVS